MSKVIQYFSVGIVKSNRKLTTEIAYKKFFFFFFKTSSESLIEVAGNWALNESGTPCGRPEIRFRDRSIYIIFLLDFMPYICKYDIKKNIEPPVSNKGKLSMGAKSLTSGKKTSKQKER